MPSSGTTYVFEGDNGLFQRLLHISFMYTQLLVIHRYLLLIKIRHIAQQIQFGAPLALSPPSPPAPPCPLGTGEATSNDLPD